MKSGVEDLNKAFENRARLGIMSLLAVNETLDFTAIKTYLELTDGNLATHIKALEKEGYIELKKSFVGRKPNTNYFITPLGKTAFENHLKAMEQLIAIQAQNKHLKTGINV